MTRTKKPKSEPILQLESERVLQNGLHEEVLTLAEASAYLRIPQSEVIALVQAQDLPGRFSGSEWRFLKSAIQNWLSTFATPTKGSKEAWLSLAGSCKDDPDLEDIVEQAYRSRGRPITQNGSYKNFSG